MKFNIFIPFLLIGTLQMALSQEINLFGNLQFGLHEVGVRSLLHQYNDDGKTRDLRITIWYPASSKGAPLTFADYLGNASKNSKAQRLKDISTAIGGNENLFAEDTLSAILNFSMKASLDALPTKEAFPLLLWSIRYETVAYQSIASEYLASHGYVIAFAEDIPNSPFPWALLSANEKIDAVNQQVRDMNAVIRFLQQQANVHPTKVGLVAWSYAGESAVLTQMSNPEIDLVMGLSGISLSSGIYLGPDLAGQVDIEKLSVPYLILSERVGTNGKQRHPPAQLRFMHPQSRYISFETLAHGNFNALEGMIPGVLRTNKVQSWSSGGNGAQHGYEATCKMALSFLNSIFSNKSSGVFDTELHSLQSQLPEGFFSIFPSGRN